MAAAGRMHTYLATATLSYLRDGATKQRQMNQVIAVEEHRVNLITLEAAKAELIQRLGTEMGVPKEDLKDFVFTSMAYLGHMSEREFTGQAKQPAAPKPTKAFDA